MGREMLLGPAVPPGGERASSGARRSSVGNEDTRPSRSREVRRHRYPARRHAHPQNTQETKTALSCTRLRGQGWAHTRPQGWKGAAQSRDTPARCPTRRAHKLSAPAPQRRALRTPLL